MKRLFLLTLFFLSFTALAIADDRVGATGQSPLQATQKSLKEQAFVVETDDETATDALNRVSGEIDLGFATPDQTYQSENQTKAGPFGRQEAVDSAEENAKASQRY